MNDAIYPNSGFDFSHSLPNGDAELLNQFGFIPGFKEFVIARQVHALEHATIWLLSAEINSRKTKLTISHLSADNETISGLSTEKGFFLYGDINPANLRKAVSSALIRLQQGEENLALHPRCGTNASVAAVLTAGMAITAHLTLPRSLFPQIIGVGLAALTANYLAPDLGIYVQKYLTTAIPFNLRLQKITKITDKSSSSGYFVHLKWIGDYS